MCRFFVRRSGLRDFLISNLPMREYYRRDRKENSLKPLFPGYLFVYSDMGREELHGFLLEHRVKVASFLRELGRSDRDLPKERQMFLGEHSVY